MTGHREKLRAALPSYAQLELEPDGQLRHDRGRPSLVHNDGRTQREPHAHVLVEGPAPADVGLHLKY